MIIKPIKLYVPTSCSLCQKESKGRRAVDGTARLPRNWKRLNEKPVCRECWVSIFGPKPRTIVIPIQRAEGVKKEKFDYFISTFGNEFAKLKTWFFRYYFRNDPIHTYSGIIRFRPMEINGKSLWSESVRESRKYFYYFRRAEKDSCALDAFKKYIKYRISILRGNRWEKGFYAPQPIPLKKDSQWKNLRYGNENTTESGGDHNFRVDVRIGHEDAKVINPVLTLTNKWITVILAGNKRFKWQHNHIKNIINKKYIPLDFKILRRPGTARTKQTKGHTLFLKMLAWIPLEYQNVKFNKNVQN